MLKLTLPKGRNFLKKPGKVYFQCRFNNEILSTDPVDIASSPIWDTELAWDVPAKVLGFLRSQRASLKLTCYTVDSLKRRDTIGYVMLDLRGATASGPLPEKWMPLVNTKDKTGFKPAVKISFGVVLKGDLPENVVSVQKNLSQSPIKKLKESKETAKVRPDVSNLSRDPSIQQGLSTLAGPSSNALPIKLNDQGYYQIGSGSTQWLLWITIAFAERLGQLDTPQTLSEFYFYYTFLGNDITTQKFGNLERPDFPAERVSIRMRASETDLQSFLTGNGNLIIYLCQDTSVLGFTTVQLSELFSAPGPHLRVIEKVVSLMNGNQELVVSGDGKSPAIGVSLALTKEAQVDQVETSTNNQIKEVRALKTEKRGVTIEEPAMRTNPSQLNHAISLPKEVQQNFKSIEEPVPTEIAVENPQPAHWHQYRFSVDLRAVRDFQPKSANVFFKYYYTPFGTSAPSITHPPASLVKSSQDALLPHSFCAFEFVMSPERLAIYFDAVPLVIEMWHKDEFAKDVPLGISTLNLATVLQQKPKIMGEEAKASVYSLDTFYLVSASGHDEDGCKKVADLRVVLALEDFGPVEEEFVEPAPASSTVPAQSESKVKQAPSGNELPKTIQTKTAGPSEARRDTLPIHDTPEYKVAFELELYRQEEEKKFRAHLQAREADLLSQLVNEWKKRESERESTLKRKMDEIKVLETQFQNLITDLEARERKIDQGEEDLVHRRQDVEREFDRRIEEARDATRRLQEEFKHRIEIEKQKTADLEAQKTRVVKEREDWEVRYKALEVEFTEFKRGLGTTSEAQLRAEINTLIQSKANLESQVVQLTHSKKHYKTEWMKTLASLAKVKKDHQAELEVNQNREKRELQRLKIQYLAKEELGMVDSDRHTLKGLRAELEEIKNQNFNGYRSLPLQSSVRPDKELPFQSAPQKENLSQEQIMEIDRLSKERDSLLRSGAYSKEDRIIRELNLRISQMLM